MKNLQRMLVHTGQGVLVSPKNSKKENTKVQLYKFEITKPRFNPPILKTKEFIDGIETIIDLYSDGYDLPKEYDDIIKNAVFAIPPKAVITIKYLLNQAESQSDMPMYGGYDTAIRGMLHGICNKYIELAIKLICDYQFDEETNYHAKAPKHLPRNILSKLMLYKFWSGRTGRGMQWFNSGFDDYINRNPYWSDEKPEDKEFYYIAMEIENQSRIDEERWDYYKVDNHRCIRSTMGPLPEDMKIEDIEIGFKPYDKETIEKLKEEHSDKCVCSSDKEDCECGVESLPNMIDETEVNYKLYIVSASYLKHYKHNIQCICGGDTYKVAAMDETKALHLAKNKFYSEFVGHTHPMSFTPLSDVNFEISEIPIPDEIIIKNAGVIKNI